METERKFLCADLGTSSLKAAVIDGSGGLLAFSRELYGRGPVLLEVRDWEAAFFRALENMAVSLGGGLLPVDAVVVSGNGPTLVPVMEDGASLPPLHWYMPAEPCREPSFFLPKIKHFKQQNPSLYDKTAFFLSSQEWLSWRLGARPVTVLPQPAYERYYWDGEQCASLGIDRGKLSPLVPLGSAAGTTAADLSPALPPGLPVIAAGPDFVMALIGTGAVEPGKVCDRAGSSEGINVCVRGEPLLQSSARPPLARTGGTALPSLRVLPGAAAGLWNVSVVIPESGKLFDDYMKEKGLSSYSAVLAGLDTLQAGGARQMDGSLMKVLETIAGRVREALFTLEEEGFPVDEMILSGGQSKSPSWNRLKARLTGRTLLAPEIHDAELAGDAIIGALALSGNFSGGEGLRAGALVEMVRSMVRIEERYES